MGKNLDNKCKQCRRAGEKLFLKGERCYSPKCAIVKRNYPPGFHGPKGKRRSSDYGLQLAEKQKAKKTYNILEKQFRLTFDRAQKQSGDAGQNFLKLLEMRLDNTVYRLGIASSRIGARQLVSHGHITVNKRKAGIPSMTLKIGDVIAIKKSSLDKRYFKDIKERLKKAQLPSWLNWQSDEFQAKVLHEPQEKDLNANINMQMIIEYYSK